MSIPTQRPTGRTGVSESEAWFRRAPAPISIPLDPALTRRELARLPKAPERIRAAYEQRGSPQVLPALVREIAAELNLHERQVENVLSLLPRKRETMTETKPEAMPEARPKLTALLPTTRPDALRNLNWERAYRVAAILDRLGVDLRYYVGEPVTAQIAHELDMTISSVSQYTSAVRRACGIECLGRRPEGGAVEVAPAPVEILPDDNAAPKATAGSRVLEVGAKAEMCGRGHWFLTDLQGPQCPLCELYDLGALLNPKPTDLRNTLKEPGSEWHGKTLAGRVEWLREEHYVAANTAAELRGDLKGANARIAALNADYDASTEQHRQALDSLKSEMLFHKTQCEAAVKRAKAAEERLEQTTTQWGKLTADHAALEGRCAALQARDTPQPVAVPEVQLRLPEALPALTDDLRDEAAQLLFVGGEFSTGWKELAWAQKATVLQLAADMATLAAGR